MQPHDIICRAVIYPRAINRDVFDEEQFLQFESLKDSNKTVYALSVVSYHLIRTCCEVHRYGETAAAAGNARLKAKRGYVPNEDERVYLGFYWLEYCDVLNVKMKFYGLHVKWRPEKGCDAHFQIEMRQDKFSGNRGERKRDRLVATNRIWNLLYGPCVPEPASVKAQPFVQKLPARRIYPNSMS